MNYVGSEMLVYLLRACPWVKLPKKRQVRILVLGAECVVMAFAPGYGTSIATRASNHSFRASWIIAYLKNGGTLEKVASMANHASTRLYDRLKMRLEDSLTFRSSILI